MTYRKSEHPLIVPIYIAAALVLGISIGLGLGVKVRSCPERLADGRPLLGLVLATGECKYPGVPRPLVEVSSVELRRMAYMRDRMNKTGRKKR